MSAYVIVDTKISNPEVYEEYKKMARPLVEKHGGHGTAVLRLADDYGDVQMCDCLERVKPSDACVADGRAVRVGLRPFEIATIRSERPA